MKFSRSAIGLMMFAGVLALNASAFAQIKSAPVDLQVFRPAPDTKGYVTVNGAQILAPKDVSFGMVLTGGWHPLRLTAGNADLGGGVIQEKKLLIKYLVTTTLQGAIGLFQTDHLGLQLGLSMPIAVVGGEATPSELGNPTSEVNGIYYPERFQTNYQGAGDLTIAPKIRLLNPSRKRLGLALVPAVVLPTGAKQKFLGEGKTIFQPQAIVEMNWGRFGVFRTALNLGLRLRLNEESEFIDDATNFPRAVLPREIHPNNRSLTQQVPGATAQNHNTNAGIRVGNEFLAGIGVAWGIFPFVLDLVGELYTFTGLDSKKINSDGTTSTMAPGGEAIVGLKAYLAPNSFFEFGGGYGVIPTSYGTTRGRLFVGIVFEPGAGDRDGDGYKDDVDGCPDKPEDFDEFEDADGCPDPDNDKDRILDVFDDCPNDPEVYNGFKDEDGCPDGVIHDRDKDGILDNVDQCPDDPEDKDGFQDEDGCPDLDNDSDGILDKLDVCPNQPEDKDGFEDEDGCPEADNDRDRILDERDKCPNEPETYNGNEDEDGCPDKGLVIVQRGKLEILDKIYFETDKDIIKEISFPLLDAIAATIKGHPEIQLIEIQGHADERGDDAHNYDLTDRRALSVMRALEDRGVEVGRLRSKGYGENKPICRQHTEDCWSKNRRVEFIILKRQDEQILQGDAGQ
jgi:outer membrane protein OmpA-like peptidoglycan-associated protein